MILFYLNYFSRSRFLLVFILILKASLHSAFVYTTDTKAPKTAKLCSSRFVMDRSFLRFGYCIIREFHAETFLLFFYHVWLSWKVLNEYNKIKEKRTFIVHGCTFYDCDEVCCIFNYLLQQNKKFFKKKLFIFMFVFIVISASSIRLHYVVIN